MEMYGTVVISDYKSKRKGNLKTHRDSVHGDVWPVVISKMSWRCAEPLDQSCKILLINYSLLVWN